MPAPHDDPRGCRYGGGWSYPWPLPPTARASPDARLTSKSVLAASRKWGLCFFMIFRKAPRGAVRLILFLPVLLLLLPWQGSAPPAAVRIRRPGAGALPPWRTSQRPSAAPRRAVPGAGLPSAARALPRQPLHSRKGGGGRLFYLEQHRAVAVCSAPSPAPRRLGFSGPEAGGCRLAHRRPVAEQKVGMVWEESRPRDGVTRVGWA